MFGLSHLGALGRVAMLPLCRPYQQSPSMIQDTTLTFPQHEYEEWRMKDFCASTDSGTAEAPQEERASRGHVSESGSEGFA